MRQDQLSEWSYISLIAIVAMVALVIHGFSRLKELDLKNLRMTLKEVKQVKQEIEQMYGGIEKYRREPLVLDGEKQEELGLSGGFPATSAVMRYPAGCIKRERERLARIFVNEKTPENIAKAILDNSFDDKVFKWNGPESLLNDPPKSVAQRKTEEESDRDNES